jgi:uncharacterized protein (DUF58 family)
VPANSTGVPRNPQGSPPSLLEAPQGWWAQWQAARQAKRARALTQVRFALSREGFHFALILLFVLLGAVLRDISLLVVLAGVMFGLLLIQWRLASGTLADLRLTRQAPASIVCGQVADIAVTITNPRRLLGAWLLSVEELVTQHMPAEEAAYARGMVLIDDVAPGSLRRETYQIRFNRRGLFELGPATISTRYPLNLGRATRMYLEPVRILVHPRLGELTARCQELLRVENQGLSRAVARAGANDGEFYGLREWHNGDSQRWIHWRTTARLGELSVRQFQQQQRMQLTIVLDLHQPDGEPGNAAGHRAVVEEAVAFVASLAVQWVGRGRHKLSVAIAGRELSVAPSVQSRILVNELLDDLACATSTPDNDLPQALEQLLPTLVRQPQLLVVSTRANRMLEILDELPDSTGKQILERLSPRWLDVSAGELEPYFRWSESK